MRVGGSNKKKNFTELPTRLFVVDYLFFLSGHYIKEEPESEAYFLTTFTVL